MFKNIKKRLQSGNKSERARESAQERDGAKFKILRSRCLLYFQFISYNYTTNKQKNTHKKSIKKFIKTLLKKIICLMFAFNDAQNRISLPFSESR